MSQHTIDPQIAAAIRSADEDEARLIAGLAQILSNMIEAKRASTETARADLAAVLNPNLARPKTKAELDADFYRGRQH